MSCAATGIPRYHKKQSLRVAASLMVIVVVMLLVSTRLTKIPGSWVAKFLSRRGISSNVEGAYGTSSKTAKLIVTSLTIVAVALSVGGIVVLPSVAVGFSMAAGIAVRTMVGAGCSLPVLAPQETSRVITTSQCL